MHQSKENMDIIINEYFPTTKSALLKDIFVGSLTNSFDVHLYEAAKKYDSNKYDVGQWLFSNIMYYYISQYLPLLKEVGIFSKITSQNGTVTFYSDSGTAITHIRLNYIFHKEISQALKDVFDWRENEEYNE